MGKKNSTFGKLLAFTTTVAAIGGACYIFRDQIKESTIYKKASDKFNGLRNKMNDQYTNEDDDFFFDDDFEDDFEEDVFSEDAKKSREYTSITINPKEDDENPSTDIAKEVANDISKAVENLKESTSNIEDEAKDIVEDTIPTISFDNDASDKKDETSATEEVLGYENEGLSDVYEDPDTLADMDKLDF